MSLTCLLPTDTYTPRYPDNNPNYSPMYRKINENEEQGRASFDSRLSKVIDYIDHEMASRNEQMQNKEDEIVQLREKLAECRQSTEGLHQLMNKLLNDIEKYQKDIDWYKRTYESRSLLGVLKDKFFGRTHTENRKP